MKYKLPQNMRLYEGDMRARHFSSPYSGTIEDPVTGTSSGVMGAYYLEYVSDETKKELMIEQGIEIAKDGKVFVEVIRNGELIDVKISGNSTYNKVIEI